MPPRIVWLDDEQVPMPPAGRALDHASNAPGLLAAGGRLSLRRLREAYSHGVFPWFSEGQPVLWWSPDPRMVLPTAQFKISRSLRKTLRAFVRDPRCEVRIDSAFERVIDACARSPREGQDGTWILPEMIAAYTAWHRAGQVHSVETWVDGELVGGLYGVALGRMFFGESMFAQQRDASKVALAALVAFCRAHGIGLIDCQQNTAHLASLGASEIARSDFLAHLRRGLVQSAPAQWTYDPALWAWLELEAAEPDASGDDRT